MVDLKAMLVVQAGSHLAVTIEWGARVFLVNEPHQLQIQRRFADWLQIFGDERLTAALLDRLTHHANIIELVGESYRFRQRMQQEIGDGEVEKSEENTPAGQGPGPNTK